ncbi:MAG: stage II sporulation protein P, partial [Oscillospiraceae bacterium]|nr:stage II sporulation protein P [Oscillospiraceae bacterium]
MDHQQWSLRAGAGAIVCALLLRLTATGFFQPVAELLAKPNIASILIYLETGRLVRFSPSPGSVEVFARESATPDFAVAQKQKAEPHQTEPQKRDMPTFSGAEAEKIEFKNSAGVTFDAAGLLAQPLQWKLASDKPTVLILHTHATESYTRAAGETYKETSAFRTLDEGYNMISVGDRLAQLLEAGGITVVHDRELHDYPSYSGSYNH